MLSGATDLEKRPEPEDMREPMRWLMRGFPGPGVAVTELTPGERGRAAPRGRPRPRAGPSRSPPAATRSPSSAWERCRRRARCRSRGSPTAGSRPTGAAPTASTSSGRCACRGRSRRPLPATCPRAGSGRCCAAASCTSCSSGSTSSGPRSRARRRSRELVESHGATARPEEVADLRDMVERFAGSELFARIARARASAHGAAVRLHAVAAGGGRAQPARQRRGGRARRRVRPAARGRLQERRPRRPRPGRADRRVLLDAAARVRARGRCAAARSGWRSPTASSSSPSAWPSRCTRPGRPIGSRTSCSPSRPGSWTGASSRPPSRTGSCAGTAPGGPRCAPGTSSTPSAAADPPFRQVPHLLWR